MFNAETELVAWVRIEYSKYGRTEVAKNENSQCLWTQKKRMVSWVANVHNNLCSKSSWCSFNGQRIYFLVLLLSIILLYLFNYLLDDLSFCGSFPLVFVSIWIHRAVLMCTFLMCSFAKKSSSSSIYDSMKPTAFWRNNYFTLLAKWLFVEKVLLCVRDSLPAFSTARIAIWKNGERITV